MNAFSIFDMQQKRLLYTLPPESNDVWEVCWSPDGTRLAMGTSDGSVVVWNLEEVRARLDEFGINVPSTSVNVHDLPRIPQLTDDEFTKIKEVQRPTLPDKPAERSGSE
jgi:WD40 repeat protein